jgi:hypothetical protein
MSETHAITTLDDMELDAVCGGFSFSVGPVGVATQSFNPIVVTQKIRQSSSISTGSLSLSEIENDVSQTAMNVSSIG